MRLKTLAIALITAGMLAGCAAGAQDSLSATFSPAQPASTAPQPPINPSYSLLPTVMAHKTLPEFSTVDIEGVAYDRGLLQNTRLTMVYYWATYCPYCKDELPYVAELGRSMPEGSQLISVVMDIHGDEAEELALARQLVQEHNITFPLLKMDTAGALEEHAFDETRDKPFLKPTTVFYDQDGEQVGEVMVGTFSKEEYQQAVQERLGLL